MNLMIKTPQISINASSICVSRLCQESSCQGTPQDSRAFYEFQQRRGKVQGFEEILESVTRVSISNDLEFEEHNFIALMTEARQRRAKLNSAAPTIPMELRVEKALEGIHACCFRRGENHRRGRRRRRESPPSTTKH